MLSSQSVRFVLLTALTGAGLTTIACEENPGVQTGVGGERGNGTGSGDADEIPGEEPGALVSPDGSASLSGQYHLESSTGFTPPEGSTIRVSFSDEGVSFSGGCNQHFGEASFDGTTLEVSGMGSTMMGCDEERHAVDSWLADFFQAGATVVIDGDRVTLSSDLGSLVLLDREVADPDRPLVATEWTIDTLLDGQAASAFANVTGSVTFGADGEMTIDAGCNSGFGNFESTDDEITFAPVGFTEMACAGAAMDFESHLQEVFAPGTVTYEIEAGRLTVERGDIGFMAQAAE